MIPVFQECSLGAGMASVWCAKSHGPVYCPNRACSTLVDKIRRQSWGRLDGGEDSGCGPPSRASTDGGEAYFTRRQKQEERGGPAGQESEEEDTGPGSWVQTRWEIRLSPWVRRSCCRIMIQSHVCFRKLFLEVLWRMPRRRQAGGQGNPLTGYCHILGKNDYKK